MMPYLIEPFNEDKDEDELEDIEELVQFIYSPLSLIFPILPIYIAFFDSPYS